MDDVTGDLRAGSASGRIEGTGVSRISAAHSTSGGIDRRGDFASAAQIASVSGAVALTFTPAASVHIDAASLSGDVHATGLQLTNQSIAPHALWGDIQIAVRPSLCGRPAARSACLEVHNVNRRLNERA